MSYEEVELTRDCEALQIPHGAAVLLQKGTPVVITQALGGAYTVQVPTLGGLYRVDDRDADALGKELVESHADAGGQRGGPVDEAAVWTALKSVYDPEIPVNIVDLGLIYDLRIQPTEGGSSRVQVQMTLTAQGCGMGPAIARDAQRRIEQLPGVGEAAVQVVWDPPWSPHMISPEGKAKLGMA